MTRLVPVPEDVQLPSPMSSEEEAIPVPPPRAISPDRNVSGQRCWTRRKFDKTPGAGESSRFFWRSTRLQGKDRARPYPAGRCQEHGIFRTFSLLFFTTLYVVLPLPRSLSSVSLFKKRQYACY